MEFQAQLFRKPGESFRLSRPVGWNGEEVAIGTEPFVLWDPVCFILSVKIIFLRTYNVRGTVLGAGDEAKISNMVPALMALTV